MDEDSKFRLTIYGGAIVASVAVIIPLYLTASIETKSDLLLSCILYFGLFLILFVLTIEIVILHRKIHEISEAMKKIENRIP